VLVTDSLPSPSPAAYADPRLRWLAVVILMIVAWLAALPFLSSREADNTMAELQTVIVPAADADDAHRSANRTVAAAAMRQRPARIDGIDNPLSSYAWVSVRSPGADSPPAFTSNPDNDRCPFG